MGLVISWIIIAFGVLKGLFVLLCVAVGFYLGSYLDSPGEGRSLISRFMR